MTNTDKERYQGFEQGPIRPPSEASSLLIRVTRNCPWNRCSFCPVYKGEKFSLRPVEHVIKDIDTVAKYVGQILESSEGGQVSRSILNRIANDVPYNEVQAFQAALHWYRYGMESVFLQDANSLIIKPSDLIEVLGHIRTVFPWVSRITSYARSHTVARISDTDLGLMAEKGLNRIHIGMESGSDKVLERIKKGVTKADHIIAGQKVKKAGIELSEYIMPGLGGDDLSEEHAIESADALNQIDPDFIRLRTLAIPNHVELFEDWSRGVFVKCSDLTVAKEIRLFISSLNGINSYLASDHILNLFEDVRGRFPEEKSYMLGIIDTFLAMTDRDKMIYQVGRRLGLFHSVSDIENKDLKSQAEELCGRFGVTPETVDDAINELMKRYI